jgi:L-lactate dehydrogenase (cytochrome)
MADSLTYRELQAKAKSLGIKASGSKEALVEAVEAASAPASPAAAPKAKAGGGAPATIAFDEVQKHATAADCWCVIGKGVYDLSDFAPEHPGGAGVVTELAGKVATEAFLHAHPEDIMKLTMGKAGLAQARMGDADASTLPAPAAKKKGKTAAKKSDDADDDALDMSKAPPLMACLNLHDFEAIAQRVMVATGRKQAWDYYSSGACDEVTYSENVRAYQRIFLKPRILVDVHDVDVSTKILGTASTLPVYLSAVAMCGMGHPEGECAWTGAAGNFGNIFMVPNLSSKPFSEIVGARTNPSQPLWFQIYVNPDRCVVHFFCVLLLLFAHLFFVCFSSLFALFFSDIVLDKLQECEEAGVEALCITVDSAVAGKRERDLRNKLALQMKQIAAAKAAAKGTKSRKAGQCVTYPPTPPPCYLSPSVRPRTA